MSAAHSQPAKTCNVSLPSDAAGVRRQIPAAFESFNSRRLTISSPEALTVSSVVSVQCGDAMFLGEVAVCSADGNNHWHIGIRVEQILSGLEGLMSLRARLLGDPAPESATFNVATMMS